MKLLFFIHSLSAGGAERVVTTLVDHWAEHGWEVVIATTTGRESDFYSLHTDVRRVPLEMAGASGNWVQALSHNLRRLHALRALLLRERPDIAVAMMPTANALLALAAMGTRISAIGSERNCPQRLALGRFWKAIRRHAYGHLARVVAQTASNAQWLVENTTLSSDRAVVIPNPVTVPLQVNEPRLKVADVKREMACSRILLAVGRLERQKGFDYLLDVFSRLAGQCPEWGLVILGEGGERAALEAQCRERRLEGRVRLPGAVGNVGEWYEAADLYVLTSRFEGFPNTLLEALAHGLPAVAVDCETGPREILRHDVDGMLVPPDDEAALVGALERLMRDAGLRGCCSRRAKDIRERFSVETIAAQWERLFDAVRQ